MNIKVYDVEPKRWKTQIYNVRVLRIQKTFMANVTCGPIILFLNIFWRDIEKLIKYEIEKSLFEIDEKPELIMCYIKVIDSNF